MNNTRSAAVYKRDNTFYLHPLVWTDTGLLVTNPPFVAVDADAEDDELGHAVKEILAASARTVPHPSEWGLVKPLLELAGVGSEPSFFRTASQIHVEENGEEIRLTPLRNLKKSSLYDALPERTIVVARPSDRALGNAVREAFDAAE